MNHLAHVVLAGSEEGLMLGAFLGDHVKGRVDPADWPDSWVAGILLHRRIDSLSDAHPRLLELLEYLEPPWRRYGGVILDVLFDHMLTRHWSSFGPEPLECIALRIDELLARHSAVLPERLVLFSHWARQKNLWQRYGDRAMLEEIFARLAWRHGREWPLAFGLKVLDRLDKEIELAFLGMFPDLIEQAGREREQLQARARYQSIWSSM